MDVKTKARIALDLAQAASAAGKQELLDFALDVIRDGNLWWHYVNDAGESFASFAAFAGEAQNGFDDEDDDDTDDAIPQSAAVRRKAMAAVDAKIAELGRQIAAMR